MTDSEDDKTGSATVIEIFKHKYNLLKNKLGARFSSTADNEAEGFIAEDKVEEADALIAEMCKDCPEKVETFLGLLGKAWSEMQDMPAGDARTDKAEEIFTISHEIKDISSLCGYTLAAHFAESLRDYIAQTTLNLKNQKIIIQAHIDAMNTVHKSGIKEDGGPVAEELKAMVKIAIDKYH